MAVKHLVEGSKQVFVADRVRVYLDPKTGKLEVNVVLNTVSDTNAFCAALRHAAAEQLKFFQREDDIETH